MIPTTPPFGSASSSFAGTSKQATSESRIAGNEALDLSAESIKIPSNLKEVFDQEFEAELNEILFDILKQIDNSSTFEQVSSDFLEQGYDLMKNEDGSLKMARHLYVFQNNESHLALAAFMSDSLPANAINFHNIGDPHVGDPHVCDPHVCDQQIEFSERNMDAISDALQSGDMTLKEKIIRDAINQGEGLFLNAVIETLIRSGVQLDLPQEGGFFEPGGFDPR